MVSNSLLVIKTDLRSLLTNCRLCLLITACTTAGFAHASDGASATSPQKLNSLVASPANLAASSLEWNSLTTEQQLSLTPLKPVWSTLSVTHQRKWTLIASSYSAMSAEEKEKLHTRMTDWALLSPQEREVARFNFAKSKMMDAKERNNTWEAYQALSSEEKQRLAQSNADKKIKGAAVAVKQNAVKVFTPVPVTRLTPPEIRVRIGDQFAIDSKTLLPKSPLPLSK